MIQHIYNNTIENDDWIKHVRKNSTIAIRPPTPKRIGIRRLRKDGEAAPATAAATGTGDGNGFTSADLSGVYLVGASGSAVAGDGAELEKGEFVESEHPRAGNGQFGSGGGSKKPGDSDTNPKNRVIGKSAKAIEVNDASDILSHAVTGKVKSQPFLVGIRRKDEAGATVPESKAHEGKIYSSRGAVSSHGELLDEILPDGEMNDLDNFVHFYAHPDHISVSIFQSGVKLHHGAPGTPDYEEKKAQAINNINKALDHLVAKGLDPKTPVVIKLGRNEKEVEMTAKAIMTGDLHKAMGFAKADWEEEKHPRAKDGKFGAKGKGKDKKEDKPEPKEKPITHHAKTDTQTHNIPASGALQVKPTEFIQEPPKGKVKPEIEKGLALTAAVRASAFDGKPKYIYTNPDGALRVSREKPTEGKYSEVSATYSTEDGYSVTVNNYEVREGEEPEPEPVAAAKNPEQAAVRKDIVSKIDKTNIYIGIYGKVLEPTLTPEIEPYANRVRMIEAAAQMSAADNNPRYVVELKGGDVKILSKLPPKNPIFGEGYVKVTAEYKKGYSFDAITEETDFDPDSPVRFTPDERAANTKASKIVSEQPVVKSPPSIEKKKVKHLGKEYESYKINSSWEIEKIRSASFSDSDFTQDQRLAMDMWTHATHGCFAINAVLRGNIPLEVVDKVKEAKESIQDLSSLIDNRTVGSNMMLSRFVNPTSRTSYDKSDYTEAIRSLKPGETYMDSSFTATTINEQLVKDNVYKPNEDTDYPGGVIMRIFADPEVHGIFMGRSYYKGELEVLLQHHTVLECVSNKFEKVGKGGEKVRVVEFKVKSQGGPVSYA